MILDPNLPTLRDKADGPWLVLQTKTRAYRGSFTLHYDAERFRDTLPYPTMIVGKDYLKGQHEREPLPQAA